MKKISVSLLSGRDNLESIIKEINDLDIDYIHLDIMDGEFVSNKSFTYDEIKLIASLSNKPFDVHLMVKDIDSYIYNYAMLNTEYIIFHFEAMKDINIINKIKSYGIKVGVSIKPSTPVEQIHDLLPYLDQVLIMSVEPGMGGQKFIPSSIEKINILSKEIKDRGLNTIISVDGGINLDTAKLCNNADMLVIGSAFINSDNKKEFTKNVKF